MKKHFILCAFALLASCQASRPHSIVDTQLNAENNQLWSAAVQVLKTDGIIISPAAAATLHLRESISQDDIASVAADGSAGAHDIVYTLHYQFGDAAEKSVRRKEVVNNDENAYRASREQRRQVIDYLRRDALTQMLNALNAQQ